MVHEAQLDTAADSAICPIRRLLVTFRSEQETASYQPGIIRKAITTCYLFVGREGAHQWKSSLLRCGCGAVRPR
jgi:hypothetical protein